MVGPDDLGIAEARAVVLPLGAEHAAALALAGRRARQRLDAQTDGAGGQWLPAGPVIAPADAATLNRNAG